MAVAITFTQRGEPTYGTQVTALFSGIAIGTAAADRVVACTLSYESAGSILSVTIAGVAATQRAAAKEPAGATSAEIWSAVVPTGTTGDISIELTNSPTGADVGISVFEIHNATATPTDSGTNSSTGAATIVLDTVTIPTDGVGLWGWANDTAATAVAWTNASEATDFTDGNNRHSAATTATAGTPTVTADGATDDQAIAGVAWGPSGGSAVTIALTASGTDTVAASTPSSGSIFNCDLGAEAADRIIIVVNVNEVSDANDCVSVTVGGVAATKRLEYLAAGYYLHSLWTVPYPTGATATVRVIAADTTVPTVTNISVFRMTGATEVPTDTDENTGSGASLALTGLTVPSSGGAVIAWFNDDDTTAVTWTGATESFDFGDGNGNRESSAITHTAGTNTITADGGTASQAMIGVAWGPPAAGGTTNLLHGGKLIHGGILLGGLVR